MAKPKRKKSPSPSKRKASAKSKASKRSKAKQPKTKKAKLAAKRSRAAKKAAKTRARRKLERESIELGLEAEREEQAEAELRRSRGDERQLMIDCLNDMRVSSSRIHPTSLSITEPEIGARIPWLVVGRFDFVRGELHYAGLFQILSAWRDDLILEARIHPQRLSQIRIIYSDPASKRGEGDSIVSSIGAWEIVISELAHETDPSDEDSLSSRYKHTVVRSLYVYFSGRLASEVEVSL